MANSTPEFFKPPPKPTNALAYHRILSPTASVKVSPICLGGISIGSAWREKFGDNEDADALLDAFYTQGGNFIDTSNTYNAEDSERLIGDWMEKRGNRDEMVVATKYSAGYKAHQRKDVPLQSNYTGNSAKSMHISVKESLKKLKTDYIDILYVHWWDFATSVEEVMTHLHAYIMAKQVLYLGISDTPAWVVVKANAYARSHGLTAFSVYQGRWNAAYRDMEAEVIPMCEDQGMAIVSWASLGGGQLTSAEERERRSKDPHAHRGYGAREVDVKVSTALEKIAKTKNTTVQAVALAYLFHQSTYVFPIVGVQTVEQVKALPEAASIGLSRQEIEAVQDAGDFQPIFPVSFLYQWTGKEKYHLGLTPADVSQYQMAAWIQAPPKQQPYRPWEASTP